MDAESQFQTLFDNFISQLKKSNKVVEVSKHFGPNKELNEMFSYIWNLKEFHDCFKIGPLRESKNEEKAETFRKDGNKYYQKKILNKALDYYNKSIIYSHQYDSSKILNSSVPSKDILKFISTLSSETSEAKNLPFGYANRSAVLFELKNYEGCLLDISRAITHSYPSLLKSKLVERQAKCYIAQKNKKKAKELLNEGISALKDSGLEENKIENAQKSLQILLEECSLSEDKTIVMDNLEKDKYLMSNINDNVESLLNINPEIPSLSSSVSLSYSQEKGRFLVANKDIMPGKLNAFVMY